MYTTNEYRYIDIHTRNKFLFYSRKVELADEMARRVTQLGIFKLRRVKIRFCKQVYIEEPPYGIELEQLATIEHWEVKNHKAQSN